MQKLDPTKERAFVYKQGQADESGQKPVEAKMVYSEEVEKHLKEGWKDSPAAFFSMVDHNLNHGNEALVQAVGESIEGVKNMVNGSLNLDLMSPDELVEYADTNFGKSYSKKIGKKKLISKIRTLIGE